MMQYKKSLLKYSSQRFKYANMPKGPSLDHHSFNGNVRFKFARPVRDGYSTE